MNKLVLALACRNNGSRLYGKPLQSIEIKSGFRVIDNIISKELVLKYQADSIVDDELFDLISEGRVRFNKSDVSNEPCAIYFVESGNISLLIENCDEQAFVEFK